MKRLFICERPYPLYRTLVKCMEDHTNENDIVISNHVDGMEKIYPVLKEAGPFINVYFYDDVMYRKFFAYGTEREFSQFPQNIYRLLKKLYMYIQLQHKAAHITLPDGLDINRYDEIYVNDAASTLMFYLCSRKKKLIWVEHAKNVFQCKLSVVYRICFRILTVLEKTGIVYSLHGTSRWVEAVEVNNNINIIPALKKRVTEVNIDRMIDCMPAETKSDIFKLYAQAYDMNLVKERPLYIVCTSPFFKDGHVRTEKDAVDIIRNIICNKISTCVNVIIKPHPRDDIDYKRFFPDVSVCEKCISAELFDLAPYQIACVYVYRESSIVSSFPNAERVEYYTY